MTALLHNNFLFMCGKGLNYIDLRFVDRSQGVLTWYPYHTATYYKWPNLCFDRNPDISPVHPQGGRRSNFGQPVPCPTPGRIDRNSTVLAIKASSYTSNVKLQASGTNGIDDHSDVRFWGNACSSSVKDKNDFLLQTKNGMLLCNVTSD